MGYQEVVDVRRVEAAEQRDVQLDELIRNHDVRRVVAVRILRQRRDATGARAGARQRGMRNASRRASRLRRDPHATMDDGRALLRRVRNARMDGRGKETCALCAMTKGTDIRTKGYRYGALKYRYSH
jgi:hypothetical protein